MLIHLSVKNYALIEQLEIDFLTGLSVITGETGSGKSIMLGALGLILGERADLKALKDRNEKCVIEGTFQLRKELHKLFFEENDLDFDSQTFIRREITPSGKSRAFINDTPVRLPLLKELGNQLIDIHSQHQTLLLNQSNFQFDVLDAACNIGKIKAEYRCLFQSYKIIEYKLNALTKQEVEAISKRDYIAFQLKEFEGLKLEELAESDIEEELSLLSNAEEIISLTNQVSEKLNGQNSVLSKLQQIECEVEDLVKLNKGYEPLMERIKSVIIELQDVDFEISDKASSIDVNEARLAQLNELFDAINGLQRKHNVTSVKGLIVLKTSLEEDISKVASISTEIEHLQVEKDKKRAELLVLGEKLSKKREKGANPLEKEVKDLLSEMAMPHAELKVTLSPIETPTENGIENIDFLIRTNKGTSFEPLKKVASGGELSRIMLAIKSILCVNGNLYSIIFDEIDTGVSGEVAHNMGNIMQQMANHLQVISITHLPQIASKGKQHYKVYKKISEDTTSTNIQKLNHDERLLEIAQMLSGENPSDAALDNARELLRNYPANYTQTE